MRIHGIVPRNCHDPDTVRHNDVLALPGDAETSLFQSLDRAEVRDSGNLRHALYGNFHFPQVPFAGQIFRHLQVIADGVLNVRQRLLFSGAL